MDMCFFFNIQMHFLVCVALQKFIVNPLASSFYVCPFQTHAERREEKRLNLYKVNISHLLVAPAYDPRGSHQSDFELNIEKRHD